MICHRCKEESEGLVCNECTDKADQAEAMHAICRRNECGHYGRNAAGKKGCLLLPEPCKIYRWLLAGNRCVIGFHSAQSRTTTP
jgi:hypothetical protein